MSHEFESGVFNRTPAWHKLGKLWTPAFEGDKLTSQKALELADLNWQVDLVPIEYNDQETGFYLVVRDKDDSVLGSVGPEYQPIQNHQAAKVLDDLVDSDDLEIETAISIFNGKKVVILARRPEYIEISDDQYIPYIAAVLYHDGSGAARLYYTHVRIVCANTFEAAEGAVNRYFVIRHSGDTEYRLEEARKALAMSFKQSDDFVQMGRKLIDVKISDREFDRFLKRLVEDPISDEAERARKNAQDRREHIKSTWKYSDNLDNIRGTRWGALNAVIEWEQHFRSYSSDERRVATTLDGNPLQRKAKKLLAVK